ncbi:hypothetical protein [uncultured Formosa sp.]|uniref:hypothetical protein n=1 Tax=uncultured Formosa sp. TaxID=255435 RepID=UPI00262D50FC|nr:hypothetical protein [uncultured Formosa sp.]
MGKSTKFLFLLISFFILSCDSDNIDETGVETESKKYIPKTIENSINTVNYFYDSNDHIKEVRVTYSGSSNIAVKKYTYSGSLITECKCFIDGINDVTENFIYNSNDILIKSQLTYSDENTGVPGPTSIEEYEYITENEIRVKDTRSDSDKVGYHKLYLDNGNVIKNSNSDEIYEYDKKNNVEKNIVGFDKLNIIRGHYHVLFTNSTNNVIKVEDGPGVIDYQVFYDYDENDYPIAIYGIENGEKGEKTLVTYY